MVTSKPSPDPTKTRIISHMNIDHTDSLVLFLRHYNNIPPSQITHPTLLDITTTHLIISPGPSSPNVIIPLSPPMSSLSDSRTRMVEMNSSSLSGLGLSPTRINHYSPPNKLWQTALTILAILAYVTFPFSHLAADPNTFVYRLWSLNGTVPILAKAVEKVGWYAWIFMVATHTAETGLMVRKLRRYRVENKGVWWAWVGNVFLSGVAGLDRFEGLVREEEERKGKGGKH